MKGDRGGSTLLHLGVVTLSLLTAGVLIWQLYECANAGQQAALRMEAAKALMQFVLLAIVGGLATGLLNERSKERNAGAPTMSAAGTAKT